MHPYGFFRFLLFTQRSSGLDPQAAWQAMIQALIDGDREAASDCAVNLMDWLDRGGFAPVIIPELGKVASDPASPAFQLDELIVSFVCARVRADS